MSPSNDNATQVADPKGKVVKRIEHPWLGPTIWMMGFTLFLKVIVSEVIPVVRELLSGAPPCIGSNEREIPTPPPQPRVTPESAGRAIRSVPATLVILSDGTILVVSDNAPVFRIAPARK